MPLLTLFWGVQSLQPVAVPTALRFGSTASISTVPVFVATGGIRFGSNAQIVAQLLKYWQVPAGAGVGSCLSPDSAPVGVRSF